MPAAARALCVVKCRQATSVKCIRKVMFRCFLNTVVLPCLKPFSLCLSIIIWSISSYWTSEQWLTLTYALLLLVEHRPRDHFSLSSFVLCCRPVLFQLYLEPAVHTSFSKSIFQVFLGLPFDRVWNWKSTCGWPKLFRVNTVNLVKQNLLHLWRYRIFPRELFFFIREPGRVRCFTSELNIFASLSFSYIAYP